MANDKDHDKEATVPVTFEITEDMLEKVIRRAISVSQDGQDRLIMSMSMVEFAAYFSDLQKTRMYAQAEMENETMSRVLSDVKGIGSVAASTLPFRVSTIAEVDRLAEDLKGILRAPNRPDGIAVIVAQVTGKEYRLCQR